MVIDKYRFKYKLLIPFDRNTKHNNNKLNNIKEIQTYNK